MSTTWRYALPVEQTEWKFDGNTETFFTWEYMQHPGGRDPALGGVQNQDAAVIALPKQLMARPREDASAAVEIVARAEIVGPDERRSRYRGSNPLVAMHPDRHRLKVLWPKSGVSCDAGEHVRPQLFIFPESEHIVGPPRAR